MSVQGPPADAKQAQAAALQELELALRRKRVIDTNLVRLYTIKLISGQPRGKHLRI
jgi:hypothetical protein